jgi:opacity protein-like surface antigen
MKNILLILFALAPMLATAQFLEGGFFIGTSNYAGDLVEANLGVEMEETNLAAGVLLRYNINDWVSVRGSFTYGQISGSDANARAENRAQRNLSFRSNIYEFAVIPEFNILGFNPYDRFYSPYVFLGLGVFNFNPEAELDGQWFDLQPLGTEGQGLPGRPSQYNLTQLAIPMGIGFKYAITEYWTVGVEISSRYTLTDYLDDVSTTYADREDLLQFRGEIAANLANRTGEYLKTEPINTPNASRGSVNSDWYTWSGLTITYNFMDSFGGRKYGCPTNF